MWARSFCAGVMTSTPMKAISLEGEVEEEEVREGKEEEEREARDVWGVGRGASSAGGRGRGEGRIQGGRGGGKRVGEMAVEQKVMVGGPSEAGTRREEDKAFIARLQENEAMHGWDP